jgi:hypothetical protein
MNNYSFREYVDMHFILGEIRGNDAAAVRLYAKKYSQRRLPNPRRSHIIGRRIKKTAANRPFTTTAEQGEENGQLTWARVLRRVKEDGHTNIRRIQASKHKTRKTV